MKTFIIKAVIFTSILLAIAYTLQWMADEGLKKTDISLEYKEWDDITKSRINADIIIQGSSKAWKQISPKALEDAFGLSAYNLGMDGQHFAMQKWRSDVYLKYNKKPRYLIQVIALTELSNPEISYNYTQFIPVLNEGYAKKFGHNGYLNYKDFYIPLYKYCHQTRMLENGLLNFFNKKDHRHFKYKGYRASNVAWQQNDLDTVKKHFPHGMTVKIDSSVYRDFIDQIEFCKREHIDLILVCPPTNHEFQDLITNHAEIMQLYRDVATRYSLKYLDYSNDPLCDDTSKFYNFNHLNSDGAAIFNKQLVGDLREEIR